MTQTGTTPAPRTGIHPSAIISGDCSIPPSCAIGPYCVIEGPVTLADNVTLVAHVCIRGPVTIGPNTTLYPGACVGFEPQDLKIKPGMPTAGVVIGAGTMIREHVTIHAASKAPGQGPPTTIGNNVFMMANSHAGHDVRIDDNAILVNGVLLAGHSHVGKNATLSGNSAVHQFLRVGAYAFVTGVTGHARDIPPFVIVGGRNRMHGINAVGLRRAGFPRDHITRLRIAFREAFRTPRPRAEQIAILREHAADCPPVAEMADFVASSKRGIVACSTIDHDDDND
jgi:UDP-N-acetylglucosamine acyltransferase